MNEFSAAISKSFVTVDLGQPEWLLNVKIDLNKKDKKLSLSQSAYIDTILKKFGFESEGNFKRNQFRLMIMQQPLSFILDLVVLVMRKIYRLTVHGIEKL